MTSPSDRELGMHRPIARRDFLHGATLAALGTAIPGLAAAQGEPVLPDTPNYYPPILTGLRGSHSGSFENAHALRDGTFWEHAEKPEADSGRFDLIIVGAGISGLAAARFWLDANPGARILILDNHDDVGGHAKRNEFAADGGPLLMNGGTLEIDSPYPYSRVSDTLLRRLGIDPETLEKTCDDKDFYARQVLGEALFFDRETFGRDHLVTGIGAKPWAALLAEAPLSPGARDDVVRIMEQKIDYLSGLTSDQKKDRLSRISYRDYLAKLAHVRDEALPLFQKLSHDEWGVGADAVPALDVWTFDFPGFQGLNLAPGAAPRMGYTAAGYAGQSSYTFHFPDGNATIARLLVRNLIPAFLPGSTAADAVLARADYAALDRPGSAIRIRLSSTAVGVREAKSGTVSVAYVRGGKVLTAEAPSCILACYNVMIPYLCPEMPAAQKQALAYLVKIPLVYTSVGLRDWRAFARLGFAEAKCPGCYHDRVRLNPATSIGGYRSVTTPDHPTLVHMTSVPTSPGLDERSQHRAGRAALLATPFATYERSIRDQLARMLGPGGFDPARDITAITVNRWPHGYAYEYNHLFDPVWAPGQAPHEIGRARFGRIAIANSDSGAAAYTDSAIDQASRAVRELLA